MKVSSSIVTVCVTNLKLILARNRNHKFLSAVNSIACASSSVLVDEEYLVENSTSSDDNQVTNDCDFIWQDNDCYFSGVDDGCKFIDMGLNNFDSKLVEDDEMRIIKQILCKRGWNLNTQNGFRIDLNEQNVILIMNDLIEESGNAALVLYFFRWSESCTNLVHSIRPICTMIHILVCGNMNYRAVELIRYLVMNNREEEECHDVVIDVLYETYREISVLQTVYSMLINCYVKENMIDMALRSTYKIKGLNMFPSIRVCNTLVKALLGSQKLDLAWDFLEAMQNHGIKFNASIISLFISDYCVKGGIQSGWKLLTAMKNHGVTPDVVAYTIVINSLCKVSRLKEGTSILFKMIQMGISLDSVSVSSVIDGYCKNGKPAEALKIFNLFNFPPNIYLYNSFISKFCTDGDMIKASEFFFEMLELGLLPDCFSYTTMIGGYCNSNNIYKALEFFGKMLTRGIKPSLITHTLFINHFCKSGNMEMAEKFFQNSIREGLVHDVVLYNTLIDGYGKKGYVHKAYELLDMMRSVEISPNTVTYNTIIHSLIARGFGSEAKDMLEELTRRGFSPDVVTFTEIIIGVSKSGNFEEVFLLWRYMSENQIKPDIVTCSALINGYCKARRLEQAKVLFNKFLDFGLIPDLIMYNTLLRGFCNIGNIDESCNLLCMMVEQGLVPNNSTFDALVIGLGKKRVKDPIQSAVFMLQKIFLQCGIHVDMDFLDMIRKPENVEGV